MLRSLLCRGVFVVVLVVVAVGCGRFPPPVTGGPQGPKCVVTRQASGDGYRSLAAAVAEAGTGETIVVEGTCRGTTRIQGVGSGEDEIERVLTISGKATLALGTPTLDGTRLDVPILQVFDGVVLTVKSLTIANGTTGIHLNGDPTAMYAHVPTVALDAVTVTGNSAGGVVNGGGQLYLNAGTKITNNLAVRGGGIYTDGTSNVFLNTGSIVTGNRATIAGGGIFLCSCRYSGDVWLRGGVVTGNTAPEGPDIYRFVFDPNE